MKKKQQQWYRRTEKKLYDFKKMPYQRDSLLQQLEILKLQLMPSVTSSYEPRYSANHNVSNPVEKAVIERNEGKIVQQLEVRLKVIESDIVVIEAAMLNIFNKEQKEIVRLHYFEQRAWSYTADAMGMSRSTYFRERNQIVKDMAWLFGYLPKSESEDYMGVLLMEPALWV